MWKYQAGNFPFLLCISMSKSASIVWRNYKLLRTRTKIHEIFAYTTLQQQILASYRGCFFCCQITFFFLFRVPLVFVMRLKSWGNPYAFCPWDISMCVTRSQEARAEWKSPFGELRGCRSSRGGNPRVVLKDDKTRARNAESRMITPLRNVCIRLRSKPYVLVRPLDPRAR